MTIIERLQRAVLWLLGACNVLLLLTLHTIDNYRINRWFLLAAVLTCAAAIGIIIYLNLFFGG